MKVFKVIVKNEKTELANGYPSDFYDVDGKICFKVKLFEEISEYKIKGSEEAIRNHLKDSNIVSVEYLEDFNTVWDKAAPEDYISWIGKGELITRTYKGEEDQPCRRDVQETYSKDREAYMNRGLNSLEF